MYIHKWNDQDDASRDSPEPAFNAQHLQHFPHAIPVRHQSPSTHRVQHAPPHWLWHHSCLTQQFVTSSICEQLLLRAWIVAWLYYYNVTCQNSQTLIWSTGECLTIRWIIMTYRDKKTADVQPTEQVEPVLRMWPLAAYTVHACAVNNTHLTHFSSESSASANLWL